VRHRGGEIGPVACALEAEQQCVAEVDQVGRSVERAIGGSGPGTVERGDRAIEIRRVAEELEPLNEPGSQISQSGRVSRDELGGPVFSLFEACDGAIEVGGGAGAAIPQPERLAGRAEQPWQGRRIVGQLLDGLVEDPDATVEILRCAVVLVAHSPCSSQQLDDRRLRADHGTRNCHACVNDSIALSRSAESALRW
jgi:hypothetical protein